MMPERRKYRMYRLHTSPIRTEILAEAHMTTDQAAMLNAASEDPFTQWYPTPQEAYNVVHPIR